MKKLVLLAVAAAGISACSLGPRLIYGANRNLTFDTRQDVAAFYQKKNDFDTKELYFFENSADYYAIVGDTTKTKSLPYYGIALGDDKMVADPREKNTCVGVTARYMQAYDPASHTEANPFKGRVLRNVNGEPLTFSASEPTVVLFGHSNLGRAFKSDLKYYKETAAASGKKFRYVVVSLDIPKSDNPMWKAGK